MENTFYMLITDSGLYQLRIKGSHFCVAACSKESCLNTVRNYVLKYKTKEALDEVISNLSYGSKVPATTFEYCKDALRAHENVCEDEIAEVVHEALKEVREMARNKYSKVRKPKVVKRPITSTAQEEVISPRPKLKALRKPCHI
jgi:hypothetical protein